MGGKSTKNNNRGSNLLGFVSGKDEQYHTNQFAASDLSGLTASGGTTTEPGNGYKYHFFTSSGTFSVTEIGDLAAEVEYLVVAGGGGGGKGGEQGGDDRHAGGGGAGGFRTHLNFQYQHLQVLTQ